MSLFVVLALALTLATVAALVSGLWRGHDGAMGPSPTSGVAVLRAQLAAVERDLNAARLDASAAAQLRQEIGRRLLEEHDGARTPLSSDPARGTAVVIGLGLPLLALFLYLRLGQTDAVQQPPRAAPEARASATQLEAMAGQMLQALQARKAQGQAQADDAAAWAMAARTLASVQRFADAEQALAQAIELRPNDASLLADRADLLALLQGGSAEGEPMKLIDRALVADPDHPKALALAGSAAWARGDAKGAQTHWQRALDQLPAGSEFAQRLAQSLAEVRQALQARGMTTATSASTSPRIETPGTLRAPSVRGRLTIAPALRAGLRPDDTVFIVARARQGPRMPLAILRLRVADLPAEFTLDDQQAMDPALRLSRFDEVVVTARVSRGGQALPVSGDAIAAPVTARLGARGVALHIDQRQP